MKLLALEKRDRGDFIAVYRAFKGLKKMDRGDIFIFVDRTKGHEKKLKKTTCKREKKYSFPYRSIEA